MSDDDHFGIIGARLRAWGYGHFLPVFAAGMSTADCVNIAVPVFESAVVSVLARNRQTLFQCSVGRRHTVGCATLRLFFPDCWWTSSYVFSRTHVVMGGPVANNPLFVLSEIPVGDMVAPESYELTIYSLCNQPDWVKQMMFRIAEDHRDEEETGCWSTLFDTFMGLKQVLKSESILSYDYSLSFGMVDVKTHNEIYWTSLLKTYDPLIQLVDPVEAPSSFLVAQLQSIYANEDFPILSSMQPSFWKLDDSHMFYAGYSEGEDCFLVGKCDLDGRVV